MPIDTAIQSLIKKLPKVELHLHIEGSLEPDMVFALATKNGVSLPFENVEALRAAYSFAHLQSFLDIYYAGTHVLIRESDFYDMTYAYMKRAHQDNVVHTEIFFDPQSHTSRGISLGAVFGGIKRALEDAKKDFGITSHLIMCFLRHLEEEDAIRTFEAAKPFYSEFIGVGLDSSEKGNPPSKFKRVFDRAREAGFKTVAHAGEEGPPEYIVEALDLLHVSRIDHGVRAIESDTLVERLAKEQIPLTVCPLSNIKLRVFNEMKDHTLKRLLDRGVRVMINSDDPAYFGGYIGANYEAAAEGLALSAADLIKLGENAVEASFLADARKAELVRLVRSAS